MNIFEVIARGIADELEQSGLQVKPYRPCYNFPCWSVGQTVAPYSKIVLENDVIRVSLVSGYRTLHYGDPGLVDTLVTLLEEARWTYLKQSPTVSPTS